MDYAIDVQAPSGGSYNDVYAECIPAQQVKQGVPHRAMRQDDHSEMCMMSPEKILWSTEDGYRAWRARNERSLARLIDQYWTEHNAAVMHIDPREQIALLEHATRKHWLQRVFDVFGIKALKMTYEPIGDGTLAMSGGGCVPRHPYKDVKAGCDKVKLDLKGGKNKKGKKVEQKSRIYFVLTRDHIKRICGGRGYKYVSAPKVTKCTSKHLFETGTVKTNIHWLDGVSRGVFDAAGQYYIRTATNYDIKDWKKHLKSIPIFFERCNLSNIGGCSVAVVVCLNETTIKALSKPSTGRSGAESPARRVAPRPPVLRPARILPVRRVAPQPPVRRKAPATFVTPPDPR